MRGKALGFITNRDRSDVDSEAKMAELERIMQTTVRIELVHAPPPKPEWLTSEDRRELAAQLDLRPEEYTMEAMPEEPQEEDDGLVFSLD